MHNIACWSFAVIDFAWVHSKALQSSKFALHWVPLATALNGCRQTGSSTLSAHNVGTYRPYESNYLGASNISVMDCTAVLTAPFTHIERKPRAYMPAIRAYARRAREAINLKHLAAMPVRLVSDLAGKLAHSRIGYRTRKFVVSKHPLHVVRLYRQRLVLANQLTTRFVQEILACVSNTGVQASYPKPLLSVSVRSCLVRIYYPHPNPLPEGEGTFLVQTDRDAPSRRPDEELAPSPRPSPFRRRATAHALALLCARKTSPF